MSSFVDEHTRFEHYDVIYISPHLDDAVYSCAGQIVQERRAGRRVLVVTLFGDGQQEPVSKVTGRFADFATRREEDRAAMARIDADYVWLNYPDLVFRRPTFSDLLRIAWPFLRLTPSAMQADLVRELLALCERCLAPGGRVMFPFSVGFHPDHRIAFDVGRALHSVGRYTVEFYEDVPYTLAPIMRALRLRYLGVTRTETPLVRSAHEMNQALFRYFGVLWLTFLPTLVYTFVLLQVQRLFRAEDRLAGEPPPTPKPDRSIADVIDDKVAAMRLYPTQTELFLTMSDQIYGMLQESDGSYVERSWVFPPFPQPSRRLARLGLSQEETSAVPAREVLR